MKLKSIHPELDELLAHLDLNIQGTAQAAAEQPRLFQQAADYRIVKLRARQLFDRQHEEIQSQRRLEIRSEWIARGDKLTEGRLDELIAVDQSVRKVAEAKDSAVAADEASRLLLEAYRMRRDSIEVIKDLAATEIAVSRLQQAGMTKLKGVQKKLRNKYQSEEV